MPDIDPITLEIVIQRLISVVREMRAAVFRTARSVAIYEAKDFSCGLFDSQAQVVAQSEDICGHVVPLPWHVRAARDAFVDGICPRDVILLNDPYVGGTHLNDVTLVYPIFREGELTMFAAVREHWADVGGAVPGSLSGTAADIYQEGIRIPPVKIVEQGQINETAMAILLSNMRVPDERLGDFHSGLAACRTAERRLEEMFDRYGAALVLDCVKQNLDRSEHRMRGRIALLPDGEYCFEDYLETFGESGLEPLLLPLKLTISGDTLTADFTGASPQVPVPVNSTEAVTTGGVVITLKAALDPHASMNHGSFRPLTVIAPTATVVNVQHPAPAGSHGEIRKRVMAVMLGALSQAVPELITADVHRTSFHNMIGGLHPQTGKEFVHYEWGSGGNGGFAEGDGPSGMAAVDWGDLNTVQPTEVIETSFPLQVEFSRLGINSAGDGEHRGGLGMRRGIRLLADRANYSLLSDGAVVPPFGILGGSAAAPVDSFIVRNGDKVSFDTPGKVGGFPMQRDDVVVLQAGGGGGYGDPLRRSVEAVSEDVREGYITAEWAREHYGAVLNVDLTPDTDATTALRAVLAAARIYFEVCDTGADLYAHGRVSKRRSCLLNPADLDALAIRPGDLVELSSGTGAPLRAWSKATEDVMEGTVPLDGFARRALSVAVGDHLAVRPLRPVRIC